MVARYQVSKTVFRSVYLYSFGNLALGEKLIEGIWKVSHCIEFGHSAEFFKEASQVYQKSNKG